MNNNTNTHSNIDHVDAHVGAQLRKRRQEMKMSQQRLASGVALTFQQIQKYEKGLNRISASKLYAFCNILGVKIDYFFKGLKDNATSEYDYDDQLENAALADASIGAYSAVNPDQEAAMLMHSFMKIKDRHLKDQVLNLVKSLSASQKEKHSEEN